MAVGRYPFGIALSPDDRTLLVTHVGVFQYTHLRPATPAGNDNSTTRCAIRARAIPTKRGTIAMIAIKKVDPQ